MHSGISQESSNLKYIATVQSVKNYVVKSKMNTLGVLTIICLSITAYCESTRIHRCGTATYRGGVHYSKELKVNCDDSEVNKRIKQFTSISNNLVNYVVKIMSKDFKLKSKVRIDNFYQKLHIYMYDIL